MSEMVERVLDVMIGRGLIAETHDAIAIIKAMREPTEVMKGLAFLWRSQNPRMVVSVPRSGGR